MKITMYRNILVFLNNKSIFASTIHIIELKVVNICMLWYACRVSSCRLAKGQGWTWPRVSDVLSRLYMQYTCRLVPAVLSSHDTASPLASSIVRQSVHIIANWGVYMTRANPGHQPKKYYNQSMRENIIIIRKLMLRWSWSNRLYQDNNVKSIVKKISRNSIRTYFNYSNLQITDVSSNKGIYRVRKIVSIER